MIDNFQQKLVNDLNNGITKYQDATIYTILLELCQNNDASEVFRMLHNAASDLGKVDEIENLYEQSKKWKWKN